MQLSMYDSSASSQTLKVEQSENIPATSASTIRKMIDLKTDCFTCFDLGYE